MTDDTLILTCPTEPTWVDPDGVEHQHTIIGCGSTNVVEDESEPGTFDCLDCGIWFHVTSMPRGTTRPTEGVCSHCSAAVRFVEGTGYVSSEPGAPDLQFCGGLEEEGNRHQVTQD